MQNKKELDEYLNDTLVNKLIQSKVPDACQRGACILGIDEAGRGPVLGPMVYAIAYYPLDKEEVLAKMKFADSKELSESAREKLFEAMQTSSQGFQDIGYNIKIISPNMISNSMLRRKKYNLNALSHDTAIDLIKSVQSKGISISKVYVDTVGPANKYKEKLQRFFPSCSFVVAEKADSKFPIVSAASVCAKVMRDRVIKNWKYAESDDLHLEAFSLGSGYPADPGTKRFLEDSVDKVFGYSTLARFSWSTITKALEKHACKCDFNEPDDDEDKPKVFFKQQAMMSNFLKKQQVAKSRSLASDTTKQAKQSAGPRTNADKFFEDRSLSRVIVW